MKIRGRLTPSELKAGSALFRSKSYWIRFAVVNWYALLLLVALAYATVVALAGFHHANWRALGMLWLVVGAILLVSLYLGRLRTSRALARLNRQLEGTFQIDSDGVHGEAESGANSFTPWNTYSEWKPDKFVYGLKSKSGAVTILPLDGLNQQEIESLRGMLRSSIGEPS
jgi:hypothetical protein